MLTKRYLYVIVYNNMKELPGIRQPMYASRRRHGNHVVNTTGNGLDIASIPPSKQRLLERDYLGTGNKPLAVARGVGMLATYCAVGQTTGSGLEAFAATAISVPLLARKPLWEFWQFCRQQRALDKITAGDRLHFPDKDIAIALPLAEKGEMTFTAGAEMQAPVRSLLASAEGIPGVDVREDKSGLGVSGSINPARAVDFMISSTIGDHQSQFLLDASSSLMSLDMAVRALPTTAPEDIAPELRSFQSLRHGQALSGLLGATATFLMTERILLAGQISDYVAQEVTHFSDLTLQSGPSTLASGLLDPSEVVTWSQIQGYRASLPA
jgi:hypothetical protein